MKLEQQVTSLEISKRLKELGTPQNSHFKWTNWHNGVLNYGQPSENFRGEWHVVTTPVWFDETVASAFTVAELGELLPQSIEVGSRLGFLTHWRKDSLYSVWYETDDDDVRPNDVLLGLSVEAKTEADARGKMLIYLIENGLCPSQSKT